MTNLNAALGRLSSLAPLVLRLAIGGVMAYHGIDKFRGGIGGVEEMFEMWQVPAPAITAAAVAVIEIVAGLALLVGVGTRLAAATLSVVLLGAMLFVKSDLGIISSQPMPGPSWTSHCWRGWWRSCCSGPVRSAPTRPWGWSRCQLRGDFLPTVPVD